MACECFVDDEEASGAVNIAAGKGSAFQEADAHGAKVVGADVPDLRIRVIAWCECRSAFDEKTRLNFAKA